jgi:hypothetical protein
MPAQIQGKKLVPIAQFHGGLNTHASTRDIKEEEFTEGWNVDSSVIGKLVTVGGFEEYFDTTNPQDDSLKDIRVVAGGYGMVSFRSDHDTYDDNEGPHGSGAGNQAEIEGYWIAIHSPPTAGVRTYHNLILFRSEQLPATSGEDYIAESGLMELGQSDSEDRMHFLFIDGGLRISPIPATEGAPPEWYPKLFWFQEKDLVYFKNGSGTINGTNDSGVSGDADEFVHGQTILQWSTGAGSADWDQPEITKVTCIDDDTNSLDRKWFVIYGAAGTFLIWIDTNASGSAPLPFTDATCDTSSGFSITGEHDAGTQQTLSDSGEAWDVDAYAGFTLTNTDDGSSGTVVSNTATSMTSTSSATVTNISEGSTSEHCRITAASHGFVDGQTIIIAGTTGYDGTYPSIESILTDSFEISKTFDSAETPGNATASSNLRGGAENKWDSGDTWTISGHDEDAFGNNNKIITCDSTTKIKAGMFISGDGIPADSEVTLVDSATQFRIDKDTTASDDDVTLTFDVDHDVAIEVITDTDNNGEQIAIDVANVIDAHANFTCSVQGRNVLITDTVNFARTDAWAGDSGFTVTTTQQGASSGSPTAYLNTQGYEMKEAFVKSPWAGGVGVNNTLNLYPEVSDFSGTMGNLAAEQADTDFGPMVGLIVNQCGGTSNEITGWGVDKENAQEYEFYASFVYGSNQESMTTLIGSGSVGGKYVENSETVAPFNDVTLIPVVCPRQGGADGAVTWDERITSVRIYYRKTDESKDIKYFCGNFPVMNSDNTENVCVRQTANDDEYAYLIGDGTGKGTGVYNALGNYFYLPPTVFTHSIKSGIRSNTTSVSCVYKTSAVLNRRLYVGNVWQKADGRSVEKWYPDRMLKSLPNRFDVLPDTEFIDVAIRDGEAIVRLAAFGNRLLQFKENTMYVIALAGAEEYLEATYKNMGVRHPEAVTVTEQGVFWVNEFGAYTFQGDKPPLNLIDGRIDNAEWSSFITKDAIIGYNPKTKTFTVLGNSETSYELDGSAIDAYYFNLITGSWNTGYGSIGDATHDKVTNFINHPMDKDGEISEQLLLYAGDTATSTSSLLVRNVGSVAETDRKFKYISKEHTMDQPHLRKKVYKVYVTYKGDVGSNKPYVKLDTVNFNGTTSTITLEAVEDWVNAATFKTAIFKVPDDDIAEVSNVLSFKIIIDGTASSGISTGFEINDMSLLLRAKSPK